MTHGPLSPVLRGGLLALVAAALFGLSTPLVQLWGRGLGPFTTAGLLYVGAGLVALWMRRPSEREAQLQRSDAGRLLAMAVFGAVMGPVALAWGLSWALRRGLRMQDEKSSVLFGRRLIDGVMFPLVLLLQFALPSEVPGYLCGLLGVRFPVYLSALAIAELPYAVGTVLAGEGVVRREGWWLVALGVLAVAFSLYAAWLLRRKLRR